MQEYFQAKLAKEKIFDPGKTVSQIAYELALNIQRILHACLSNGLAIRRRSTVF
ncbi:MAG: hypothetical protein V5804_14525 [Mucilaginibacter sp.]|uniref:hypothetical protein n=1 Tax=Mucilaginibacter sp. TaxID=1882438 RepID=UPI0034E5D621